MEEQIDLYVDVFDGLAKVRFSQRGEQAYQQKLKVATLALKVLRNDGKTVAPYLAVLHAVCSQMLLLPSMIIATMLARSADGTFRTARICQVLEHSWRIQRRG